MKHKPKNPKKDSVSKTFANHCDFAEIADFIHTNIKTKDETVVVGENENARALTVLTKHKYTITVTKFL